MEALQYRTVHDVLFLRVSFFSENSGAVLKEYIYFCNEFPDWDSFQDYFLSFGKILRKVNRLQLSSFGNKSYNCQTIKTNRV